MPRPANGPWGNEKRGMAAHSGQQSTLTAVECGAIRQAFATGRFSKRSIGRMYDVREQVIGLVVRNMYRPRREM